MIETEIRIATNTTIENINKNMGDNMDISPCIKVDEQNVNKVYNIAGIPNNPDSSIIFNFNGTIYVIPDNSDVVYRMVNNINHWEEAFRIPFSISVLSSQVLIFNNIEMGTTELHILGGNGRLAKTHFKYDLSNGERCIIASDLPYSFCSGRAVAFNNEIHIFGGGIVNYTSEEEPEGFINNHYKWDGYVWKKASTLPASCFGTTPFVHNGKLFLIGGIDNKLYMFDTKDKTWVSKDLELPNKIIHSTVVTSNRRIFILGGINKLSLSLSISGDKNGLTVGIVDIGINFPEGDCINGQFATACNNLLYLAIQDIVYINKMTNDPILQKYKSINSNLYSMGDYGLLNITNSNNEECVMVASTKTKELINLDTLESISINTNIQPFGISKNYIGDIYLFNPTINGLGGGMVLKKVISPDNEIGYIHTPFELSSKQFTSLSSSYYNGYFHIITNSKNTYNHCRLKDYSSKVELVSNILFKESEVLLNTVNHNDKLYLLTLEQTTNIINIREFNGSFWRLTASYESENIVYDAGMVEFQNKLFVIYITENTLNISILAKDSLLNVSKLDTNWTKCKAIVNNGLIQIIGSDNNNIFSRIGYYCKTESGYNTITFNMNKGRTLLCDKDNCIPIYGDVDEVECGYKAKSTGKYIFILLNKIDKESFTLS